MRSNLLVAVCSAALAMSGACVDQERNASIEAMNEGIDLVQSQSYETAIKKFEQATSMYRDNHQAWYALGTVYGQQKKWKEASDALAEAVKYSPEDAMYHYKLGQALYRSWEEKTGGSLDMAQTHLEKSVQLNARLYKAHWFLGKVYYHKDEPAKAGASWTEAAQLEAGFGKAFIDLGKLYLRWDFGQEAIAVLEQGSLGHVVDPEDLTNIYYYLGLAYDAQQNWPKAIEAYTKSIEAQKSNSDAKLQRGFSYARAGEKDKARTDLEEYVKQKGTAPGEVPGLEVQAANDLLMRLTSM
jgi:tetratricopeptide (TPR) repeat protein